MENIYWAKNVLHSSVQNISLLWQVFSEVHFNEWNNLYYYFCLTLTRTGMYQQILVKFAIYQIYPK